jgi:PKD repeat protein
MQLLRNKSTRSLWDPNYVDQSWINDRVELIPRIKGWVAAHAPGLKTAVTEYNWGAEADSNGATAQADIFGIFGREGLDYAARWTTPDPSTPTYKAMKMYRNYDGNRSTFGDTSVSAGGPNPDNVASFAAVRSSDGALTVIVVNKYLTGNTPVTVNLSNFSASGPAQVWQLAAANAITRLSDVSIAGSAFSASLPPKSVTLFVVPAGAANAPPVAVAAANPASGIAPVTVAFDGSASHDSDGTVVSWAWAFGDGATGSGVTASHTYSAVGTYTATLTVTDNKGATGKATVSISATADPNVIAAPANLTASVSRTGTVTLNWADKSSNETGFYVERAPSGSTSFVRVGSVGANVTTFAQTPGSGRYVYRVQAFNATRVSGYSNQVSVRVK